MKKLLYLFMACLVSAAMISCSSDDDGDGGDGGEAEVPREVGGLGKLTQIDVISFAGEEQAKIEYAYTYANNKVSKLVKTMPDESFVDYNVTYETDKVIVAYNDVNEGDMMTITYTLNADGKPVTASEAYSDGHEKSVISFEYEAGKLKTIKDTSHDDEVVFAATYTGGTMATCNTLNIEGRFEFKYGKNVNVNEMDPTFIFTFVLGTEITSVNMAAMLGLIPTLSTLPNKVENIVKSDEEGKPDVSIGTMDITPVLFVNDKLDKYKVAAGGVAAMELDYTYAAK